MAPARWRGYARYADDVGAIYVIRYLLVARFMPLAGARERCFAMPLHAVAARCLYACRYYAMPLCRYG